MTIHSNTTLANAATQPCSSAREAVLDYISRRLSEALDHDTAASLFDTPQVAVEILDFMVQRASALTADGEVDTSITERDGYIRLKALLYAIAHIQSLPQELQERSDMADMCALFRHEMTHNGQFDVPVSAALVFGVEAHTGVAIDLWPDCDANPRKYFSPEERVTKRVFKLHMEAMYERFNAMRAKEYARRAC